MTKKQMKTLAKQIAKLEYIIQHSQNNDEIYDAKNKMIHLTESTELDLSEMIELDEMVAVFLKDNEKN